MWFTKEENVEEYSNILGFSFFYLIPLIPAQIENIIITIPINCYMISITIFFPSFIATEFGSFKMWMLIQIGIYNLLFFIFTRKGYVPPTRAVERLHPLVFFTRKFKIVFESSSSCFPKQIAKLKLGILCGEGGRRLKLTWIFSKNIHLKYCHFNLLMSLKKCGLVLLRKTD